MYQWLVVAVCSALALLVNACSATKIQQHNIGCFDRSKADVLRSATTLLVQHGFNVTHADTVVGLVQGETAESRDAWTGMITKRVWQVNVSPVLDKQTSSSAAALTAPAGKQSLYIIATARTVNRTQNAFGATIATAEQYYDDTSHEDWEWYWGVRNGLEAICGSKAVITTKKVH